MTSIHNFDPQQLEAYNHISEGNFDHVLVCGGAGCGKTYTVGRALADKMTKNPKLKVICASATHKAKRVFSSAVNGYLDPNLVEKKLEDDTLKYTTLASMLKKQPMPDPESGRMTFISPSPKSVKIGSAYDLLIVDEVGMMSLRDSDLLTHPEADIPPTIFLGDNRQLLPVMAKANDLFRRKDIERFELDTQHRSVGSIDELANRSRFKAYFPQPEDQSEEVQLSDSLVEDVIDLIRDGEEAVYLAYRNRTVDTAARKIREAVVGFTDEPYTVGEMIRVDKAASAFSIAGEVCRIVTVSHERLRSLVDPNRVVYDSYLLTVKSEELNRFVSLRVISEYQRGLLDQMIKNARNQARTLQYKGDHDGANAAYNLAWKEQNRFDSVGSPYAMTIHKSQGSTYQNVAIDCWDLKGSSGQTRLLYTGKTRAAKKLIFNHVENRKP